MRGCIRYKKLFLVEIRVNFFLLHLGLENLLVRLNEQSSQIMKNFFIKKKFNSEPVYNYKYIKTKIKIYNDKVYKNFQHSKMALFISE